MTRGRDDEVLRGATRVTGSNGHSEMCGINTLRFNDREQARGSRRRSPCLREPATAQKSAISSVKSPIHGGNAARKKVFFGQDEDIHVNTIIVSCINKIYNLFFFFEEFYFIVYIKIFIYFNI